MVRRTRFTTSAARHARPQVAPETNPATRCIRAKEEIEEETCESQLLASVHDEVTTAPQNKAGDQRLGSDDSGAGDSRGVVMLVRKTSSLSWTFSLVT